MRNIRPESEAVVSFHIERHLYSVCVCVCVCVEWALKFVWTGELSFISSAGTMGSLSPGWWGPEGGQRGPVEPGEGGLRLGISLWPRTSPCLMERTADPSWVKWHLCFEVYVFVPMCLCVCVCVWGRGRRREVFEKLVALCKVSFFFFLFSFSLRLCFSLGF